MELPIIKIPEITLPFDVPVLLHPPVDHFIIALPIVVLLLEIINLIAKKRAIGVVSFFLIILTTVAAVAAYFTGTVDGKEAWDLLSQAGQSELKEHKIFGTYLMLASGIVLLFKLLSAMIQRGMMKGLFLLILMLFVIGILKQGKDGGELVYKYGANVQIVKTMDDKIFELQEQVDDHISKEKKTEKTVPSVEKTPEAAVVTESIDENTTVAETTHEAKKETVSEPVKNNVEEKASEVTETAEAAEKKVDEAKENVTTPSTAIETAEKKAEEVKEKVTEAEAKVETLTEEAKVSSEEVVPSVEVPKPEIATH
jgi:uncharacterized membrane protein